ncbi:hypothetical protein ULF88_01965 [Halopseudomonas pachastrellae]|nr:hypothetical protein [Halopseudomonas pachastrellae]
MSCDFLSLARPGVQKLSPYVPGKPVEELAREFGLRPQDIVKRPVTRIRWARARRYVRPLLRHWQN